MKAGIAASIPSPAKRTLGLILGGKRRKIGFSKSIFPDGSMRDHNPGSRNAGM